MTEQPDSPPDATPETPPDLAPSAAAAAPAAAPAADSHELGANAAKAYVPPTVLVARKAPVIEQQKVKIAVGVDPRQASTEPRPSPRPVGGDGVLPFVKPAGPVQPPPAPAPAPSGAAHDEPAAPAPQAFAPVPAAAPGGVAADGSSPWTAEHSFDAALLPSASLDFLAPAAPDGPAGKAASVPPVGSSHGMRPLFIAGLAVAAVVLVAVVLYIATRPSDAGGGPTSVGAGSENNEFPEEASARASASASVSARPPAPVKAKPTRKSGDPYDGLD